MTPGGVVELFREFYGPSVRTFAALDAAGRGVTRGQAHRSVELTQHRVTPGSTYVEAEYLEVKIAVG